MLRILVLGLCLSVFLAAEAAAASAKEALDSRLRAAEALIAARLDREAVPGGAIGIVHDQNLIWNSNFGVESYETQNPVTADTLFSICSVSKLFTSIAVMNLVEEGRVDLDAPIADYLGGLEARDDTGAEEPPTIRNILAHVSGLPREGVFDYWGNLSFPDKEGFDVHVRENDLLYRPYDYWQYSNLGMAMLGQVIEQTTNAGFGAYVRETILEPLAMRGSETDMPFERVGAGFAQGYYVRNRSGERKPAPAHAFKAFAAAAGLASSVNDLAKFASWHFRLREKGGEEILQATTLRNMQRVHWMGAELNEPAWGLGYATRRYDDKTMWGHGGYCPGARTEFVMRLPSKLAYIMMITANDVAPGALVRTVYDLTAEQISAVHGKDKKDRKKKKSKAKLSDYEGYFLVENYDNDVYVGVNENDLFVIDIFAPKPVETLITLVHEEGDRFRRQRDDKTLAESVNFERDERGRVVSFVHHGYRKTRRAD